jgi:hypothetical protein
MMTPKRKEALGKFLFNFALLYAGAGAVNKIFSSEPHNYSYIIFTLLTTPFVVIIALLLHTKE